MYVQYIDKSARTISVLFLAEYLASYVRLPSYLNIPHDRWVQLPLHCPPMARGYLSTESSVIIPSVHVWSSL